MMKITEKIRLNKSAVALLLFFCALFLLVSCGKNKNENVSVTDKSRENTAAQSETLTEAVKLTNKIYEIAGGTDGETQYYTKQSLPDRKTDAVTENIASPSKPKLFTVAHETVTAVNEKHEIKKPVRTSAAQNPGVIYISPGTTAKPVVTTKPTTAKPTTTKPTTAKPTTTQPTEQPRTELFSGIVLPYIDI